MPKSLPQCLNAPAELAQVILDVASEGAYSIQELHVSIALVLHKLLMKFPAEEKEQARHECVVFLVGLAESLLDDDLAEDIF